MSSATTNTPPHLQNLLAKFDVERLGEGDLAAGANLLAAMACSIANVQRPGSGFVTSDGETIAVGTNILVSGARSVSLISEKVLARLASRQNNFLCQLTKKADSLEEETTSAMRPMAISPAEFAARQTEVIPDILFRPEAWRDSQGTAEYWSNLVEAPTQLTLDDLTAQPMVFVTGLTPKELGPQLERSHLGRPYVHVGATSAADFARFEQICPTLMDVPAQRRRHRSPWSRARGLGIRHLTFRPAVVGPCREPLASRRGRRVSFRLARFCYRKKVAVLSINETIKPLVPWKSQVATLSAYTGFFRAIFLS